MTAGRAKVLASLAAAGRPQMWANEQETAALSGMSYDTYRERLPAWESRGFPPINAENGKRSIPAILKFWRLEANDGAGRQESVDERELERWSH